GRYVMRATTSSRILSILSFASVALLSAGLATAGTLHPALEARIAALPPDTPIPVIVVLTAKTDTKAAAASAEGLPRRARTHAVVNALRSLAERTQPPIAAHLAQEQANGAVHKVKPFWVFNGFAVTAT